jgi:hypothetical protein
MNIFKMLCHVHVDVYLEQKQVKQYKCLWKTCLGFSFREGERK